MSDKEVQVDWNDDGFLDIDECHAKIKQLRAELVQTKALAALVTPELAALLERLAEIMPAWGDGAVHRADLDEALTLAASIHEALEVAE